MKPLTYLIAIALVGVCLISGRGQTTGVSPTTKPTSSPTPTRGDVVRITTNLVQVDVTVLDPKGQPVSDLTTEDFDVTEDGRPQKITNLSFIAPASTTRVASAPPPKPAKGEAPAPPPPPVSLRPDQVKRAIALVVDDLGLSFESSKYVRMTLRKFVDEQMQPGDLVAIIRTGAGMGALQQFTADKRLLYAAIERVRYNLSSRGFNAFAPVDSMSGFTTGSTNSASNKNELINSPLDMTSLGTQSNQYRDDIFSVGTLGALNFIVRGLRSLPGRKSVILFSDGFRIYDEDQGSRRILDNINRLADLANRASVVIYTIDPRGLQTLGLTAADDLSGPIGTFKNDNAYFGDPHPVVSLQQVDSDLQKRSSNFRATQAGLNYLSQQTGGLSVRNTNDLDGAVRRVLTFQKGYYLLGYRPDETTVNQQGRREAFHHIDVKVKRPGVVVRTRTGFYGYTDEESAKPVYRSASDQLNAALASPFTSGDIRVRMSSVFGHDPVRGSFTESILHVDAHDLTFSKLPDGKYKTSFEILAVTFGDSGAVVGQDSRSYSITLDDAELEHTYNAGIIYVVTLPIKKAGPYQLRMAIRDTASAHVGSANQFIEIPDVKKKNLTLSGIIFTAADSRSKTPATLPASVSATQPNPAENSTPAASKQIKDHALAGQAIRRFRQRQMLSYGYYIYNAKLDSSRRPHLETQLRLFRDGKLVYAGKARPLDVTAQSDMRQIVAGGEILLGTDLPPGEYVAQVIVIDKLASGEKSLTTQWMDFDVVE